MILINLQLVICAEDNGLWYNNLGMNRNAEWVISWGWWWLIRFGNAGTREDEMGMNVRIRICD